MCWLAPEAGQGEVSLSSCRVSCDPFAMCPIPSQANALAPLTPGHSAALDMGHHNQAKDWTMGCRGNLVLGCSLGGVVVATVGAYSSGNSEATQISDSRPSTIACTQNYAESPHRPHLIC